MFNVKTETIVKSAQLLAELANQMQDPKVSLKSVMFKLNQCISCDNIEQLTKLQNCYFLPLATLLIANKSTFAQNFGF